ncbi:MAG TPA: YdcF family protein, partial [Rhodospirillales bacterium]|nr:YdcF family protein [Rhodospirillales bacterium]
TGGSERLNTGLRLLAENKAKRVFVSGVHPAVDVERLAQLGGRPDDDLQQRIEAGHGARDTHGNAEETAAWIRQRGYRSLRLVTGSYHMPRSLLEFREAMPEARVVPHPVFPDRVKQASWWLRPGTAALIVGEYNKFLFACIGHGWRALSARLPSGSGR